MRQLIILGLIIFSIWSCSSEPTSIDDIQEFQGPFVEIENGETIFTDSSVIKLKMYSKLQLEFENGNREFPEGIFIEFFEEGEKAATLKANSGYYNKENDKYTALGDVEVVNYLEHNKLNTEELHWTPVDQKIFTEKFVRIESDTEILTGDGMTANQDLTSYEILYPKGVFTIPEEDLQDTLQTTNEPVVQ